MTVPLACRDAPPTTRSTGPLIWMRPSTARSARCRRCSSSRPASPAYATESCTPACRRARGHGGADAGRPLEAPRERQLRGNRVPADASGGAGGNGLGGAGRRRGCSRRPRTRSRGHEHEAEAPPARGAIVQQLRGVRSVAGRAQAVRHRASRDDAGRAPVRRGRADDDAGQLRPTPAVSFDTFDDYEAWRESSRIRGLGDVPAAQPGVPVEIVPATAAAHCGVRGAQHPLRLANGRRLARWVVRRRAKPRRAVSRDRLEDLRPAARPARQQRPARRAKRLRAAGSSGGGGRTATPPR